MQIDGEGIPLRDLRIIICEIFRLEEAEGLGHIHHCPTPNKVFLLSTGNASDNIRFGPACPNSPHPLGVGGTAGGRTHKSA